MNILTILKSRLKKEEENQQTKLRRQVCKSCPTNSNNLKKLNLKTKILIFLSDLLTFITFRKKTTLGTCSHPDCGCDIFFKTQEENEECPENNWTSIYIPNSAHKNKKQWK